MLGQESAAEEIGRREGGMDLIEMRGSLVTMWMIVRMLWWLWVCVACAESLRGGSYSVAGRESQAK